MVRPAPGIEVTSEMLDLFARGLELVSQGHGETNYDAPVDSPEYREFLRIGKRLEWTLIGLPPHCASVLNPAVDGPPHDYLTPGHMMWQDWGLVQAWRRTLMAALDARGRSAVASPPAS